MRCFLNKYFNLGETTKWIIDNINKKIKSKKRHGKCICDLNRNINFKFNNGAVFLLEILDNNAHISMIYEGIIDKDNYFTNTNKHNNTHVFSTNDRIIKLNFLMEIYKLQDKYTLKSAKIYIIINCDEDKNMEHIYKFITTHINLQDIHYLFTSVEKKSIETLDRIINTVYKSSIHHTTHTAHTAHTSHLNKRFDRVMVLPCSKDIGLNCYDKFTDDKKNYDMSHIDAKHPPPKAGAKSDNYNYLAMSHIKIDWSSYIYKDANFCKDFNFLEFIIKYIEDKPMTGGYDKKYIKYKYKYLELKNKLSLDG